MTTCIIVDVQFIAREGLRAHFDTACRDIDVVGMASCSTEASELITRLQPDFALVDLVVPGGDTVGLVTELRRHGCTVPIIVYSATVDPYVVERAMDAGVNGYVVKDTSADLLDRAVTRVLAGRRYIDPDIALALLDDMGGVLTVREHEVLSLASLGMPNKTIAFQMQLGTETVRTHMASIIGKLQAANRTGAVAKALRLSIID